MKIASKFLIIIILSFVSCSKSETQTQEEKTIYYNRINVNGTQILSLESEDLSLQKNVNLLQIKFESYIPGSAFVPENVFSFQFNGFGDIGNVRLLRDNLEYNNFFYDSGSNFLFELEEYDEVMRTVKGNYSGKIYSDEHDLNSQFVNVDGSFFLKLPEDYDRNFLAQTSIKLKIDGNDWRSTIFLDNYYTVYPNFSNSFMSDDKYRISIAHLRTNANGIHNFDNSTTDFYVKLEKYDAATNQFVSYISSEGVLNINSAITLPPSGTTFAYKGTFSFTATNPNSPFDVITITDGEVNFEGI